MMTVDKASSVALTRSVSLEAKTPAALTRTAAIVVSAARQAHVSLPVLQFAARMPIAMPVLSVAQREFASLETTIALATETVAKALCADQ